MLVRLHEKGYGFLECPQLFAKHDRDVFIQSALVEQLMGGPRARWWTPSTGRPDVPNPAFEDHDSGTHGAHDMWEVYGGRRGCPS
eukprot:gene15200-14706_t